MRPSRGSPGMRISVVINTYNRGPSLRQTLHALRHQTYEAFEVIAVNGPSTDDTLRVLAEFPDVRVAHCPEVHLSKSRNIGIDEAAGDVVAFIDDDALPEPTWLEELAAAYNSEKVGGAGGLVYDHTGFSYQYRKSFCDRLGKTRFDLKAPYTPYVQPGADPFAYLQGTNCSFRRRCLVAIGGFDEEIEYYMDEVDVCRRVIDSGHELRLLDGAAVHHKYLASHRRNSNKIVLDPFPNVKNHCYLAVLNNLERLSLDELKAIARAYADSVQGVAHVHFERHKITEAQRDFFLAQVERGLEVGVARGLQNQRLHRTFAAADPARFRQFHTPWPAEGRLKVCFVSLEYPPGDFGGIGRFTADLATGFAARGHEVHVVTRSPDINRVDFEDGVWMHRLAAPERIVPDLDQSPLGGNLFHSSAVYHEVRRIHEHHPLDVISAPLWSCEGLVCVLDRERFPTVLTLMTSMNTIAAMHPSWSSSEATRQIIALERTTAQQARYLHPISKAILETVRTDYAATEGWAEVQPLGVRDRRAQYPRRRADDKVRILFVGRLERRKGVDVLLEAAVRLLKRFPQVEFVLVGKDTPNTETGTTYRAQFQKLHGQDSAMGGRVTFAGAVSEEELYQHYADADIVCMPSRYESFGLVLVEGMAFGKPVVGCSVGGMREIVEVEGNGLLARAGDADSLEQCLARLIQDDALRERYCRRSRQLYEKRFTLPLVVERTARYYGAIAVRHAQAERSAPVADEELARRLAEVVGKVTGLPQVAAARAGADLLDRAYWPVDHLAVVRRLLQQSDEEFLTGLYQLTLNREIDDDGQVHYLRKLRAGARRTGIVRILATCAEARQGGLPTQWLTALRCGPWLLTLPLQAWDAVKRLIDAACRRDGASSLILRRALMSRIPRATKPSADRRRDETMPTMSLASRLLRKLRTAASPRTLVRYLKRVVLLPWNSQKVYDRVVNLHALQMQVHQSVTETLLTFVREVQDRQDMLEQRLAETLRVLTTYLREHTVLQAQDLRQVKNRFAELYGALLTDQQKQTQRMADLARLVEELRQALAAGSAHEVESPPQPRIARPGELCPEREVLARVADADGRKGLRSAG